MIIIVKTKHESWEEGTFTFLGITFTFIGVEISLARPIIIIIVKTKHESWEEGRVELKPLSAEAEDIRVSSNDQISDMFSIKGMSCQIYFYFPSHLQVIFSAKRGNRQAGTLEDEQ